MIYNLPCTSTVSLLKLISVQQLHCIYRAFTCRHVDLLVRAYLTYVRPLVEQKSVIWSPYTVKDIENIETVQRRFTKRLPGFCALSYTERLKRLNLPSLEFITASPH